MSLRCVARQVVPDNTNNTLGVALGVADVTTGTLLPGVAAVVNGKHLGRRAGWRDGAWLRAQA